MSGMTMTQSTIARDLNSYSSSMWFTTAYLIAASALAPLVGRLATIFPPRALVPAAAGLMALGCVCSARSATFAQFVASRVIMGLGAAGVMTLAVVFVLGLVREKRRGMFIGLVNVGFTIGLSFGAVVFGAAEPVVGWVGCSPWFVLSMHRGLTRRRGSCSGSRRRLRRSRVWGCTSRCHPRSASTSRARTAPSARRSSR